MRHLTIDQVRERLTQMSDGRRLAYAKEIGVSPQYLIDVIKGRSPPGPKMLAALGMTRVVLYESRY